MFCEVGNVGKKEIKKVETMSALSAHVVTVKYKG